MDTAHLEVVAVPFVNHAMAHNGIRAVQRIVLTAPDGAGTAPLLDVVVRARLVDHRGAVLSRPWQHHADRIDPGDRLVVDHPPIELDPAAVLDIEEEIGADLLVSAAAAGVDVLETRTPIRVLAARQWLVDPTAPLLSLELLAAFVQPNHPAIGPLTARTAAQLESDTGSGSLAVSNVLPGRVDALVAAACTVIHDLGVYYAEPPASWGYGQQVRGPGDVVEHHLGTCLDTTVLLASLLEHLGVHPVLWIARGHAFLGYWRTPDTGLPDAASFEVATAVNAVGLGLMGVIETTMLTRERRPPRDLFRRICQAPLDTYLHGDPGALVGVIDVHLARLLHVRPIPARVTRPDGVVEVVDYRPAPDESGSAHPPAGPTGMPGGERDGIPVGPPGRPEPPPRVQVWKNALLDLTLRNRLLNFGRGVTQLPLLMPGERLGLLADLLEDRRPVSLRAVDDLAGAVVGREARDAYGLPADVQRNMLRDKATVYSAADTETHKALVARLRYRARTGLQETGANPLALTLGRVDWRLGERDLSAPLLLAPVEITGVIQPYRVLADETGSMTLNLSLLEKWRLEFGFTVPGLDELPRRPAGGPGEGGVDVDEVVRRVRQALLDAGLPFTVQTEARLAIVGFTGYLLWRDLDEHWETFLRRPVARHLALTPTDRFADPATASTDPNEPADTSVAGLDAVVAGAPIPADGSQAEAIAAARAGRTFVLEGPPGTGKSQTITNILADQMSAGRRVLFVAEKGAALDVVRRRLVDIGLAPFALDLHDEHASPAVVRAQLRAALAQNPHPDEDGHRIAGGEVSASARTLGSFTERLHSPGPAGLSAYAAHAQALALGAGPVAPVPADWVGAGAGDLAAARRAVVEAAGLLPGLGANACAAWGFAERMPAEPDGVTGLAGLGGLVPAADLAVSDLLDRLGGADDSQRAALGAATTPLDLDRLAWLLGDDATPTSVLAEARSSRWRQARAELGSRTDALCAKAGSVLAQLSPEAFDVPVEPVRQAVREAAASFFLGRKGRLVRAAAPLLVHLLPGVSVPPKALPALVEQVAALGAEADDLAGAWRSLPGLGTLSTRPSLLAPASVEAVTDALAAVDRDLALFDALPASARGALERARAEAGPLVDAAIAAARGAAAAIAAVIDTTADPTESTDAQVREWARARGLLEAWTDGAATRSADARGALLGRWVEAIAALEPLRRVGLAQARWALLSGALDPIDAPAALDRGIAAAAVRERFQAGALGTFDPAAHGRVVDRFVASSDTLRQGLRGILPARVVAERPFAPGAWFGTVAALEREVSRTRGGLSVRGLVRAYGEVIAELTPCLLVSPDSLARFVPPGAIDFDLVVFDEASQITVADAIGALGRARSAVVAGDSKQMPPSSFGELSAPELESRLDTGPAGERGVGPEGDDAQAAADFQLVPDEESILSELVHAGVERLWLSWHYRSQDESLIVFSNAHYYDDRLSSFPAFPGQTQDTGLSFTRVQGTFLRSGGQGAGTLRTNPIEAAAVVEEVLRRWRAGERSIGVVTFNLQQRTLIERMLWDSGVAGVAESLAAGRDGLFVKNLENVQGDERDVILFSTGFSATRSGVLPLNFGPLNRAGGERRLNVAVTRARRRVMVFCSFEPEDLRVEQTASVGIRHLRDYLELAKYGTEGAPPSAARGPIDGAVPEAGEATAGGSVATLQAAGRVRHETVDRHREDVAAALRATGLTVETAVGLSDFRVDLAVGRPGARPVVAVLLDGPAWAARRTTADRDGLPRTVLHEVMGWPEVLRIWLPEWLAGRDEVVARVREAVARAEAAPRRVAGRVVTSTYAALPQDAPAPEAEPPAPWADRPVPEDRPAAAEPFVAFVPTILAGSSVLDGATRQARHTARVQEVIRSVVATEGPVALDRALLLTARCFGMTRPPAYRLAELRGIVPADLRRDPEEGFLWPATRDPLQWIGFRTWDGSLRDRPLDEIPLRELGNAAAAITRSAMGIGVDELLRQTLRAFNGARLTEAPRARLLAGLRVAEQRGQLRQLGGLVTPGASGL